MLVLIRKYFALIHMAMFCIIMLTLLHLLHGTLIIGFPAQVIDIYLSSFIKDCNNSKITLNNA